MSTTRKVLALAEARIFQCQVLDKYGAPQQISVYMCGPDCFISETMDGLFSRDQRRPMPEWMKKQLQALPASQMYDFKGDVMTEHDLPAATRSARNTTRRRTKAMDDDIEAKSA